MDAVKTVSHMKDGVAVTVTFDYKILPYNFHVCLMIKWEDCQLCSYREQANKQTKYERKDYIRRGLCGGVTFWWTQGKKGRIGMKLWNIPTSNFILVCSFFFFMENNIAIDLVEWSNDLQLVWTSCYNHILLHLYDFSYNYQRSLITLTTQ